MQRSLSPHTLISVTRFAKLLHSHWQPASGLRHSMPSSQVHAPNRSSYKSSWCNCTCNSSMHTGIGQWRLSLPLPLPPATDLPAINYHPCATWNDDSNISGTSLTQQLLHW